MISLAAASDEGAVRLEGGTHCLTETAATDESVAPGSPLTSADESDAIHCLPAAAASEEGDTSKHALKVSTACLPDSIM